MQRYKAVLFAVDGDWVTDYHGSESVEAVQDALGNMGSRWFFYPFEAIVRDNGRRVTTDRLRIVYAPMWGPARDIEGMTIGQASRWIAENADMLREVYA